MKVALVHDWLVSYRGGEKVLAAFCELFPQAPIYTLFCDKEKLPDFFKTKDIRYSRHVNKLRPIRKALLPIYPVLIESIDLSEYDLVISTSSCVAKSVITHPDCFHLSYIHSPMRYIWDQRYAYFPHLRKYPLFNFLIESLFSYLRLWDSTSAQRIDCIVANSSFVQKRIEKFYGKKSFLVHPPIHMPQTKKRVAKKDYFIVAGAFVAYKRFDLAILACEAMNHPLIVAGSGEEIKNLKKISKKTSTIFIDQPSDETLSHLLAEAKALIFPGVEDFGMIAIESMSLGTPVIAYKKGGAKDFIIPDKTGVFFESQEVVHLSNVLKDFDASLFKTDVLEDFAKGFDKEKFMSSIKQILSSELEGKLIRE